MDSRGVFDAAKATRNDESALHGLRISRAGYELAAAVTQARKLGTYMRWGYGGARLADSLTKLNARKTWLVFSAAGQTHVMHDPSFESFKKVHANAKAFKQVQDALASGNL